MACDDQTHTPHLDPSVFVAPGGIVRGDVEIGADSNIWFNAVVRSDLAEIRIGERVNVQDGSVLHVDHDYPLIYHMQHCSLSIKTAEELTSLCYLSSTTPYTLAFVSNSVNTKIPGD